TTERLVSKIKGNFVAGVHKIFPTNPASPTHHP
ncbi:unnamed protein product, partial [marine sediment metagenome]